MATTNGNGSANPMKFRRRTENPRHRLFLFLALLSIMALVVPFMPASRAAGNDRPLPPRNPWAHDRPDDNGQKVDLGWSESPSPEIIAYRVYRSEKPGGPYFLVSERSTHAFINYLGYVDTGLTDGVTYYYRVTAVDRWGRESEPTPELSATPEAQLFQAAVTIQKSMVISLAEQKLYCLENGRVVYIFLVSTGTGANPTPTGNFHILYHDYAHPVPKYPGCVCYYWMGFYKDYAIHAWPTYNGVQGDYSSLGRPASHGCVRLDPTQAHIPYYWAPDGTPLSIIPGYFQPPAPPIRGGHAAASVSQASTQWYFAEGFTGGGFDEYLLVLNPEDNPARVTFEFMLPDGSVRSREYSVSPHSRLTVGVDALPGLESTEVSARVTSDRPVVVERAMYFDYGGKTGGHVTAGSNILSTQWYFAEGFTGGGFDEYLLVLNPEDNPARVTFEFMLPDGSVRSREYSVSPHSRLTVGVDALPGLESTEVSARVTSDRPVVVERAMYFGYPECPGGHAELGRVQASSRHYLAEGYTSPFFDTYLLVYNPEEALLTANIFFLKPDGAVVPHTMQLGPRSRGTLKINQVPGLEWGEFSIMVEASGSCLVERSTYFNFPR